MRSAATIDDRGSASHAFHCLMAQHCQLASSLRRAADVNGRRRLRFAKTEPLVVPSTSRSTTPFRWRRQERGTIYRRHSRLQRRWLHSDAISELSSFDRHFYTDFTYERTRM